MNIQVNLIIDWIEAHSATIDLLKWAFLLLLAWITGAFRLIRLLTKKPRVEILEDSSFFAVEEQWDPWESEGNHKDNNGLAAAFFLDLCITNPTKEKVVISRCELCYVTRPLLLRRRVIWNRWSMPSSARILPMVSLEDNQFTVFPEKWLSRYPNDPQSKAILIGTIEPKERAAAPVLFLGLKERAFVQHHRLKVRIIIQFTTGETIKSSFYIRIRTSSFSDFCEIVQGRLLEDSQRGIR